ncbi:peptidase S58 DmpA [Allomuricauda ruestringensis DSM 13258]|uniref:Peptidase S58 DmpA n=1 Tax=Allomuricauda ruestringensis (strain DSM 13258 / CIP 107369 / LMG 19739 / B1) TaxID=886377 RepID=G2PPS0_ALLRU|nr:P1 family peptidase [Allomuricauda ruestringensis]AEM70451.1 peptidase S58 DmpA [Allomuricauda ruestringensis DSM 13258]
MNKRNHSFCFLLYIFPLLVLSQNRLRDHGVEIGVLKPGALNAITDVPGVQVGHSTLIEGDNVRTGVTAILPHSGNIFQEKVPAAIYVGNGFGKLAGYTQVKELGNLETPILLTNTLSVPTAMNAVIGYTLNQPENEDVRSVNAVVGETNDGYLNDIRGRHITEEHVLQAISNAKSGPVTEGNVGAGTGTICFGFKGGIGTSSRVLPKKLGGYTVGVLVQTNFGGVLQIAGVEVDKQLDRYADALKYSADGSCMMVVLTDAPLDSRNLERLAKRAMLGLSRTGGIASNGSGDYVIAVSTAEACRIPYQSENPTQTMTILRNNTMTPLFLAAIEATEEAILNSLFAGETMKGRDGHTIEALPKEKVMEMLEEAGKMD